MNLKDIKKPFEIKEYKVKSGDLHYALKFYSKDVIDEYDWYSLYGNLDEESFKIIAALLNMYCFHSIDLKVLDLDNLNMISFLISQINKLDSDDNKFLDNKNS